MNKQHYSDGQWYTLAMSTAVLGKTQTRISKISFVEKVRTILMAAFLAGLLVAPVGLFAQYVKVGDATNLGGNCYRLTEAYQNNQAGAIWYISKIDLSHNVHIEGSLNLGFLDGGGADGMGFVLQPVSNGIGVFGGGLGFQGISPCLAVEFDTWQNTEFNDPYVDHIALSKNGVLNHAAPENLQGPIGLPNLEDNGNHPFIIHWNAAAKNLQVTLDGILRINYSGDIVATIFNGDDKVFWGFTGATGAATNNHTVCINSTSFTEDPTLTWTNGGGNQLWTNGANWTGGVPPAPTSDVVFNAATPSDADIDADVTVGSLTTSTDYVGTVKLNAKTLAIKKLLAIKKAFSFSKGTGKVRIIGGAIIASKAPLHKVEIETPDFEVVSIKEDLEVADDLVIKSKTGLTTPTDKQINVQGNVDIQKPMPPTPSNPLIRFWGSAAQKLKSAGGGKIVVDKTGGEVTLDASSTVQEVTVRKGWFRIPSGKTLSTSTPKPISVECQGAMKGSGFIARLMRIRKCGKIAPGNSPGTLTLTDGLEIESEGIYEYETTATETDLIVVEGAVTIDGGYLEIISNGTPSGILWLINNDGNDPVVGTFEGLPEGATVTIDGAAYIISYVGGDGNDVVLIPDACPNDPNKTEPGVCGCNVEDVPTTWYADTDGDDFGDPDDTQDGYTCIQPDGYVDNGDDACPTDPNKTEPGVCGCGVEDVPTTWYADTDEDGFGDPDDTQDGYTCIQPDGYVDNGDDACPTDPNKTEPGVCGCNVEDVPTTWYADTDGDGFGDPDDTQDGYTCIQPDGYVDNGDDACPTDPAKTEPGVCGCGVEDVPTTWYADTDGDGFGDPDDTQDGYTCIQPDGYVDNGDDACPTDPAKTEPGVCGCNVEDVPTTWYADTDGDGFGDPDDTQDGYTCIQPDGYVDNGDDACPTDPAKTEPGVCGCNVEDVPTTWYADTDEDGFGDPDDTQDGYTCIQPDGYVDNGDDACPTDPAKTEPGVCGCGTSDVDSDGDGTEDCNDECPDDPNKTEPGACGCGVEDVDSDCDGVADCNDVCPGGDDSGPCDAETFPGMNNVPTDWKCHSNNKKVYVCHNGNTICVNTNAVQAHLNHGDFLGPCTSCSQGLSAPPSMGSNAMTDGLEMHLFPNPTSGRVTVELHGLDTETAQLTVFDRLGRVVFAQKIEEGTHQLVLDFSSEQFAVGDYFIKVVSSTTTLTEKLSIFR